MSIETMGGRHPEAISLEVEERLSSAMQSVLSAKQKQRMADGYQPLDMGKVVFNERGMTLSRDGEGIQGVGSGQVYDADTSTECVVWLMDERTTEPFNFAGEQVVPLGVINILLPDPNDPEGVESLSRDIMPLRDGRVVEVDNGQHFSDDLPTSRVLSEGDVNDVIGMLADITPRI